MIISQFPISTLYESMVIFMYCFIKTDTPWFEFTVILAPLLAVTIFHGKTSWILLQNIPLLLFCKRTGWRLDGFQAIDSPPGFDNCVMEKIWSLMRDLTFSFPFLIVAENVGSSTSGMNPEVLAKKLLNFYNRSYYYRKLREWNRIKAWPRDWSPLHTKMS